MIQCFDDAEQAIKNLSKSDKVMMRTLVVLAMMVLSTTAQTDVVFPNLTADNLNSRILNLPADFSGIPTIVFIACKINRQPSINARVGRLGLA